MKSMLVPLPWSGNLDDIPHPEMQWLKNLNKKTYCALWQRWPTHDLPEGYDCYVVSFHLEAVAVDWLDQQSKKLSGLIILLSDSNYYDYPFSPNVKPYTYYYWHNQLEKIIEWHGIKSPANKKYKFSAVCNRITQSKVWITTKLLEDHRPESLIVLSDWIEDKNVHSWAPTNNQVLDSLTNTFQKKYLGQKIKIDDFDNATMNYQSITGNPWQPLITESAIHFTNESFHYSHMSRNQTSYIYPGPFITEKTLKCLVGATTFIPTGQFDVYNSLRQLGLCFDYPFDTSWDADPYNISRFKALIDLIDYFNQFSIDEICKMTHEINLQNQDFITSGKFGKLARQHNDQIIDQILGDEN